MAEKRVSVRMSAQGGDRVKQELRGVGEAGERGFDRLGKEAERASRQLSAFARRAKVAAAAATAAVAATGAAMVRQGLQTIDAQAKLAESLDTTVVSIQTLERAGELAGLSMGELEGSLTRFTRRVSLAEQDAGPAADALDRLGVSAADLADIPLDERVALVMRRLRELVPEAEQAGVATQIFGDEAGIAFSRLNPEILRQAAQDVAAFGGAVSEVEADQIELARDSLSRLSLVWSALVNRLTVAVAPALQSISEALAEIGRTVVPAFGNALRAVGDNVGRIASTAATFAAFMAGRWVAAFAAAAVSVRGLATAMLLLRRTIARSLIGALIVGAGELVFRFTRLSRAAGGVGEAIGLLGDVAAEVWQRMRFRLFALQDTFGAVAEGLQANWLDALAAVASAWDALQRRIGLSPSGETASELEAAADRARIVRRSLLDSAETLRDYAARPLESIQELRRVLASLGEDGAGDVREIGGAAAELEQQLRDAADAAGNGGGRGLSGGLDAVRDSAERVESSMQRVRSTMGRAFTSIVTGASTARDAIGRLLQSFAEMLANRAFNSLFGSIASSVGSALLTAAVGGAFGGPDLTADPTPGLAGRAAGGPVQAGAPYWINEHLHGGRRTEMFVPSTSGGVLNVQQAQQALRGGSGDPGRLDVRVFVDEDGSLRAAIERVSGDVAGRVYASREPGTVQRAVQGVYAANAEVPLK